MKKLGLLAFLFAVLIALLFVGRGDSQTPLTANQLGQIIMPPSTVLGNNLPVPAPLNAVPLSALTVTGGGGGTGGIASIALSVPPGLAVSGSPCSSQLPSCTLGVTWANTIPNAQIPPPTASALGGVESAAGSAGQFMTGISTSGIPQFSTPPGGGNVNTTGTITVGNCAQFSVDTTHITSTGNPCPSGPSGANPSGTIGLSAVNGTATSFIRSDGAPPLSQAIVPTWTGLHTFAGNIAVNGSGSGTITLQPQAAAGTYNWNWPNTAGTAGQVLTSQGGGSSAMTWANSSNATPVFQTISGASPQSATITTASYVTSTVTGGSPNSVTVTLPVGPATGTTITFILGNTQATNIVSASSNILPLESTTADTVIIGTPSTGVATAEWASIVYNGTNWNVAAGGSTGGGGGGTPTFNTYQTFTSGSSASYTATSSNVLHIKVRMVGGGGGGGAQTANAGGSGATTSFGGWSAGGATGGAAGNNSTNGAGGSGGTNGSGTQIVRTSGAAGTSGTGSPGAGTMPSGHGGSSPFGGAGAGTTNATGGAAATNSGSGGGGGGGQGSTGAGGGGGAGEYVEFIMTKAQFASATYTVGSGGAGGAAGNTAGGAGAAGIILVEEFYY